MWSPSGWIYYINSFKKIVSVDSWYQLVALENQIDIIDCLSFSLACVSLGDLYSYPSEESGPSSFLSLLLHLATLHINTPLFHSIIRLLISLLETLGYPVPRLAIKAKAMLTPVLMGFCGKLLDHQVSEDAGVDILQLLLVLAMQTQAKKRDGTLDLDVLNVLLFTLDAADRSFASMPLDVLMMIVVCVQEVFKR